MIIHKNEYKKYIVTGNVIKRSIYIHSNYSNIYTETIRVLSEPFDHKAKDGRILKRFKCISLTTQIKGESFVTTQIKGEYFVNDLFNGVVELIPDYIQSHEFCM